jgi:hypothetical protein
VTSVDPHELPTRTAACDADTAARQRRLRLVDVLVAGLMTAVLILRLVWS